MGIAGMGVLFLLDIRRHFFRHKSLKKCVCVVGLKIALLLVKTVFINVSKGMSELGLQVAAKHATMFAWIVSKEDI